MSEENKRIPMIPKHQAQVSALQLQNATSNVLRFPNSWAFNGGIFPPVQTAAA